MRLLVVRTRSGRRVRRVAGARTDDEALPKAPPRLCTSSDCGGDRKAARDACSGRRSSMKFDGKVALDHRRQPRHRPGDRGRLCARGADVALVGRDVAALEETAGAVRARRARARSRTSSRPTLPTTRRSKRVSRRRSNASAGSTSRSPTPGQSIDGLILRLKPATSTAALDVNLKSAFYLCGAVAKPMMKQRAGSIVLVSSIVGITGNAGPGRLRRDQSRACSACASPWRRNWVRGT